MKQKNLIKLLTLTTLIASAKQIFKMEANLTKDIEFCQEFYPELKSEMSFNYTINNSYNTFGVSNTKAINKLIKGESFKYVFSNFDDMALWIIVSAISFIGFTFCLGFSIIHIFKKKEILLNSDQIKKLREKKKRKKQGDDFSFEDEEDDLDEKNNPHKSEFRIILYVKFGLVLLFCGSLVIVDKQVKSFYHDYVKTSCKFTYMNQVFLTGDERNAELGFIGIEKLKNKLGNFNNYLKNTSFEGFSIEINELETKVNDFVENIEEVYLNFLNREVDSPSATVKIKLPFFKSWGPTTPFDDSAGLLHNYSLIVYKNYVNLTQNLKNIRESILAPFQVSFDSLDVKDSYSVQKMVEMDEKIDNFTKLMTEYYTDISESYLTRSFKAYKYGLNKILVIVYGTLILTVIVNALIELLYYKMRHNVWLKICIHSAWLFYGLFSATFCYLLLKVIPTKFGLVEVAEMIQPIALNSSYFKKLDFPDKGFLAPLHSCFFSGGDFISNNNSDIALRNTLFIKDSIETSLSIMVSGKLSELMVEYNNVKAVIDEYRIFGDYVYNPLSEENPEELLKKLNSMTDCNSPAYQNYGFNINYVNDCPSSTCQSTDHWVWDISQCPTGSIPWVYGTPKNNANRYCLNFGELWAYDSMNVYTRYPVSCFDSKSGNPYYTEVQYILQNLKRHYDSIQSEMGILITDLDSMIQGGTAAGINDINTYIMDNIKPKVEVMEASVKDFLAIGKEIQENKNCSFAKEFLLEIKDDLESLTSDMEMACYLSLSSVILLVSMGMTSFLIGICFRRIHKSKNKKIAKKDQIVPFMKIDNKEIENKSDKEDEIKIDKNNTPDDKIDILSNRSFGKKKLETLNTEKFKKSDNFGKSTKARTNERKEEEFIFRQNFDSEENKRMNFTNKRKRNNRVKESREKFASKNRGGNSGFRKIDDVDNKFIEALKRDGFI